MSSRSRRKSARAVDYLGEEGNEDGEGLKELPLIQLDSEDEFHDEEASAPKKRKTAAKKGTRKKKLEYFQDMSLDILYEICSHLDPINLLYMSRVTKSFRNALTCSSAISVWHTARANVYLPDLEADDLSEAGYASLVFERNCHVCGKPRASIVDYYLRARYCKACQKKTVFNANKIRRNLSYDDAILDIESFSCGPFTMTSSTRYVTGSAFYFTPHILAISKRLIEFKELISIATTREEKEQQEVALATYISRRTEIRLAMQNDGAMLRKWETTSTTDHVAENARTVLRRRVAIESRMEALGWTRADFNACWEWRNHRFIEQPRDLTDRIWTSVGPVLQALLERYKQARIAQELRQRKLKRQNALVSYYLELLQQKNDVEVGSFPSILNFLELESVKPFYESNDYIFSSEDWEAKKVDILMDAAKYGHSRKVELFRKLVKSYSVVEPTAISSALLKKVEVSDDVVDFTDEEMDFLFNRITSRLHCPKTGRFFNFKGLVLHHAQYIRATTTIQSYNSFPRDLASYEIYDVFISTSKALIELSDLKKTESQVTEEDFQSMNSLGAVFECFGCRAGYNFFTYSASTKTRLSSSGALEHVSRYHRHVTIAPFSLIRVDLVAEAKEKQAKQEADLAAKVENRKRVLELDSSLASILDWEAEAEASYSG